MRKTTIQAIRRIIRILPVNSGWPRLHRDYPLARHVALVELHSGELALVPYLGQEVERHA